MGLLPQKKTLKTASMNKMLAVLYGPSKIGKSTFCAEMEDTLFLATEPGLNHLEVFKADIDSWEKFLNICAEISQGEHQFKTIAIDTVDNLYGMCRDFVLEHQSVVHESDVPYGKGYTLINTEFQRAINKLARFGYGLIFISHSEEKTIKTRTGDTTRIVPTLPDKCRKFLVGLVDLILFASHIPVKDEKGNESFKRVLFTKSTPDFEAGDRTGKLPPVLPLNFEEFKKAYQGVDNGSE